MWGALHSKIASATDAPHDAVVAQDRLTAGPAMEPDIAQLQLAVADLVLEDDDGLRYTARQHPSKQLVRTMEADQLSGDSGPLVRVGLVTRR